MLEIGDYVLATTWSDGDPMDQWAIGFYTGMSPGARGECSRYMVTDANGKQFRSSGFRRAKKISAERGRWMLEHKQDIELGHRSLWWWARMEPDHQLD